MSVVDNFRSDIDPDLSDAPELADLKRYWESKRRGSAVPLRAAIDPAELKAHLGTLFIVEALPDLADFRYRLIGTTITRLAGRDFTNKTVGDLTDVIAPELRDSILAAYRKVLRDIVPIRVRGSLDWVDKQFIRFDSLHLPMASAEGRIDLILGKQLIQLPR